MIEIKKHVVYSTEGLKIRRKNSESFFASGKGTALPSDVPDNFEEVSSDTYISLLSYRKEVERLISERYSIGQEIQFAREKETAGDSYAEYLAYVEDCKVKAINNLTLKFIN